MLHLLLISLIVFVIMDGLIIIMMVSVRLLVDLIKIGLIRNVSVKLDLLSIMESAHFVPWDLSLVMIKPNVFVLPTKNGFQLNLHVFNVKPTQHLQLINSHAFAIKDLLTTTTTVSAMLSVELIKNGSTINVFARLALPSRMEFAQFAQLDLHQALILVNVFALLEANGSQLLSLAFNVK